MASLHRDPRGKSPFWYCAFTDANGIRRFKSTKHTHRKQAEATANGWERAAKLARRGTLTQVAALKVVSEIYENSNQEPLNSADTTTYLNEWIVSKKLTAAKGTARRYEDIVKAFLEKLGDKAKRNIAGLTPRDIAAFRDAQIDEGKSSRTANLAVKTLRIALNVARKQGIILSNPAEAVDLLPEDSGSRETFTRPQITDLLHAADKLEKHGKEWRGMILLGACHGLRLMDAARLTLANVDAERRTLCFFPKKDRKISSRKKLEIPMHPDIEDYLVSLSLKNSRPDAPIFPHLSLKKGTGANGLSNTFTTLMETAGIKREADVEKTKGVGRRFFALSYHSFRHTAISAMANAGVSKERRMKLSGHKSNVHDGYTHHDLGLLRKDVESVPSFVKKSSN